METRKINYLTIKNHKWYHDFFSAQEAPLTRRKVIKEFFAIFDILNS